MCYWAYRRLCEFPKEDRLQLKLIEMTETTFLKCYQLLDPNVSSLTRQLFEQFTGRVQYVVKHVRRATNKIFQTTLRKIHLQC